MNLNIDEPKKAYGVLPLIEPLEAVIGPRLPCMVKTVLLPFRDKIISDGLLMQYNVIFGGGTKKLFNEEYRRAKETFGIITSLGEPPSALPQKEPKKRPRKATAAAASRSAAAYAKAIARELSKITDAFCQEFLNEEYAELCRNLAMALARKRPSPLFRGRLATWASGIVRTIAWVNFLHDPSQTPHLKLYSKPSDNVIRPNKASTSRKILLWAPMAMERA